MRSRHLSLGIYHVIYPSWHKIDIYCYEILASITCHISYASTSDVLHGIKPLACIMEFIPDIISTVSRNIIQTHIFHEIMPSIPLGIYHGIYLPWDIIYPLRHNTGFCFSRKHNINHLSHLIDIYRPWDYVICCSLSLRSWQLSLSIYFWYCNHFYFLSSTFITPKNAPHCLRTIVLTSYLNLQKVSQALKSSLTQLKEILLN